jgi:tetratricopeptide (TPR) repeat protein
MRRSYFALCYPSDDITSIAVNEFVRRAKDSRLFSNLTFQEEQEQCSHERNKDEWVEVFSQPPVTMTHVKTGIVVPEIKRIMNRDGIKSGSYANMVIVKQSPDQVGVPTDFVSHAWRNSFSKFVAALEAEAKSRGSQTTRFYWNDVFVEDQVSADEKPEDYFFNAFKMAVATINRTILVLDPLKNPIPLTRAWCVWEIYSTVSTDGAELVVALPPSERATLEAVLQDEFEQITSYLSSVNSETSECYGEATQNKIHRIIREKLSFNDVDSAVTKSLRKWLSQTAMSMLKSKADTDSDSEETLRLCNQVGAMLFENHDDFLNAERILQSALTKSKLKFGDAHDLTLVLTNNLAALFKNKGNILKAEELYKIVLMHRKNNADQISQLQTALNNLASVKQIQKKYEEAETLYMDVLNLGLSQDHVVIDLESIQTLRVEDLNEKHVLKTLNNLGTLMQVQQKWKLSKIFYKLVIELVKNSEESDTEKDEKMCKANGNLGKTYYQMANFEEAEQYLTQALETQTKVYGKHHRHSMASLSYLGEVLMRSKKFEEAHPLVLEQLTLSQRSDQHLNKGVSDKTYQLAYKFAVCLGKQNMFDKAAESLQPLFVEIQKKTSAANQEIKIRILTLHANFLQQMANKCTQASRKQIDLYIETQSVLTLLLAKNAQINRADPKTEKKLSDLTKILEQLNKISSPNSPRISSELKSVVQIK